MASDIIKNNKIQVIGNLLTPAEIDIDYINNNIKKIHDLAPDLDDADIYFQKDITESWHFEDNKMKQTHFNIDGGLGVRAVLGEKSGFAYSDVINPVALSQAVNTSSSIAKVGKNLRLDINNISGNINQKIITPENKIEILDNYKLLYPAANPASLTDTEKVALLEQINAYVRQKDPKVVEAIITLSSSYEHICVARLDGYIGYDIRPLVRLNISVIVKSGDKTEQGFSGGGERSSYDYFINSDKWKSYADEAVRIALVNLESKAAPAGEMPVILGPGWPGVLLHEAIGHGLEGDFIRKGTSSFCSQMGKVVASKQCTIVDDGTLPGRRGSLSIDDEGTASEDTVLIENGKLVNVMKDRQTARLMNSTPTGNGRRESYAYLPMTRMTNTYMRNGEYDPKELIAGVNKGIFAVNFGGGQVDITSGKFVFVVSEGYLIENGKIGAPIKGATLIGHGPSALKEISMVGNDLKLDTGVGICGKDGQSVPVGVGQPSLKLDKMTVGGTAA